MVEAIHLPNRTGYLVIVISNQPDVGKGRMTLETFRKIRGKLKRKLAENAAYLDDEYYCMHHPEAVVEQYKMICDCRKPKPELLLKAVLDHDIDMPESWFIGDNLSDVEAGKSAGYRTVLLGKMETDVFNLIDDRNNKPYSTSANLIEAIQNILKTEKPRVT